MTFDIEKFAAQYAQDLAIFKDAHVRKLLESNKLTADLDVDYLVKNPMFLKSLGFMIIEEKGHTDIDGTRHYELYLVQILNSDQYRVKPPQFKITGEDHDN